MQSINTCTISPGKQPHMAVPVPVPDEDRRSGLQSGEIRALPFFQLTLASTVLPVHGVGPVVHVPAELFERPRKKAAAVSDPVPDPFAPVFPPLGPIGIGGLFQSRLFRGGPLLPGSAPDVTPVLRQGLLKKRYERLSGNHIINFFL